MKTEVEIEDRSWTAALGDPVGLTLSAVAAARVGGEATFTVLLTDDRRLHDLNLRFRGFDQATNVLAFPTAVMGQLGDVALAFGVCSAEAAAQNKPLADHLRHLVIHGLLHLLGYDHQSEADAAQMEAREADILADLGIRNPYLHETERQEDVQHGR